MLQNIQPHAPVLDDQIKAHHLSYNPIMALAELTHGEELARVDFIRQRASRGNAASSRDHRRDEEEVIIRQVMECAHYLQYEAPRFMDAWVSLARKVAEANTVLARQAKLHGEVLTLALDKIKENEPDSPAFNMAAAFVMEQDNKTGEAARAIFRSAINGDDFKVRLIELLEGHEDTRP